MKKFDTIKKLCSFFNQNLNFDQTIKGFSVDSRKVEPGEVFCALKGERVDGHLFLEEAKQRGAVLGIVDKSYKGSSSLPLLTLEDVLTGLQNLAREAIAARGVKIAAVTGSVGKTTCKDFISELAKARFKISKSAGNSNSQIGLPLTILNNTTGDEEWLILEMGMTEAGQIKKLVEIAPPTIALITQVALVHSSNFASITDIAKAKGEIFSHPKTKLGLLPYEIEDYEILSKLGTCPKSSFSLSSEKADRYLKKAGREFFLHQKKQVLGPFSFPIIGEHHEHNFAAALSCALELGLTEEEIKQRVPFLELPEKRFQFIEKRGVLFIDDSYNASEISVKAALKHLPTPSKKGAKVAVLGSMLDLGNFSLECHRRVGVEALKYADKLFCFGKECHPMVEVWHNERREAHLFDERNALMDALRSSLKEGDVVLLKGSRSKQLWKVLEEF